MKGSVAGTHPAAGAAAKHSVGHGGRPQLLQHKPHRPSPGASATSPFTGPVLRPALGGTGGRDLTQRVLLPDGEPRAPEGRSCWRSQHPPPLTPHSPHSPSQGHVPGRGRGGIPRGPPISLKVWSQHSLVLGEAEEVRSWEGTQKDPVLDGPAFGLMLRCHCLEVLNNLGAQGLAFALCSQR